MQGEAPLRSGPASQSERHRKGHTGGPRLSPPQHLQEAGARVECSSERATRYVGRLVRGLEQRTAGQPAGCALPEVGLAVLREPLAVVNVGLEVFAQSLKAQGARVIHVDWRPPAGGDERLMSILRRMKRC